MTPQQRTVMQQALDALKSWSVDSYDYGFPHEHNTQKQGRATIEVLRQALEAPSVPNGVWEALQRLIENGGVLGPASSEYALLAAPDTALIGEGDKPAQKPDALECDFCRVAVDDPWHGSTLENKHIHACSDCLPHLPGHMLAAAPKPPAAPTQAACDVLAERQRQISVEGWTPERDDRYSAGDMASAASCYATQGRHHYPEPGKPGPNWPWAAEWWKPAGYRRNLVKAAALLLAEIERLDRADKGGPIDPCNLISY